MNAKEEDGFVPKRKPKLKAIMPPTPDQEPELQLVAKEGPKEGPKIEEILDPEEPQSQSGLKKPLKKLAKIRHARVLAKRCGPKSKMRGLSPEEISKIMAMDLMTRDRLLFNLALDTGLRNSELRSIQIRDVFAYGRVVHVLSLPKKNFKKGVGREPIPLKESMQTMIGNFIAQDKNHVGDHPTAYLFYSCKKDIFHMISPRALQLRMEILKKTMQISDSINMHSWRRTFAENMYKHNGKDIRKTQRAMGHTSVTSTQRYLDVDQREVNADILALKCY